MSQYHAKIAKMLDDYEPVNNFAGKEDLLFWYNRLRNNILSLKDNSKSLPKKGE